MMKTYKTYQECKIANPECEVYYLKDKGLFTYCTQHELEVVRFVDFNSDGFKCNPANYCMNVKEFLDSGYRFVEGDLIFSTTCSDKVVLVTDNAENGRVTYSLSMANAKAHSDNERYILRAAALEERPRTKVEYVKADNEIELFSLVGGKCRRVTTQLGVISNWRNLYERIETPMTEREAFIDEAKQLCHRGESTEACLGSMFDAGCRFVN